MPPVGRPRQNIGPCAVCGIRDNKETFRRLKDWSLEKANKRSNTLLPIKLKIDDQLCIKHYNELVGYDRNNAKLSNKRKNNDFSYNSGGDQNRVYLSQKTYEQLLNNVANTEKLEQVISELKKKVNGFIHNSGM